MASRSFTLRPIGIVRNKARSRGYRRWEGVASRISIDPRFRDALEGIESYSHIVVVYWMDRVSIKERRERKAVPYGRAGAKPRGVLALRMPARPNPIGISAVRLLQRRGTVLTVQGLDAFNGTPVFDVKPYTGHRLERIERFRVPSWGKKIS